MGKKYFRQMEIKRKQGSSIYIRQIRLNKKNVKKDSHYVMIKRSIHEEDITIIKYTN